MIVQKKLNNGASVLLETVETTEVVSIGFWFNIGSGDENDTERGLTHFLEHMVFKGTKKRTPLQIAQAIDRVGGVLNAFTEKEQTCFYCTLPSEYLELAIDVLSDMIWGSIFPEEEIRREKLVVINEIKATQDSPEEVAYELYLREMWGNHPLAAKITGELNDIAAITKKDLLNFHKNRYKTTNLIVSIAGNFSPEQALSLLEKFLPEDRNERDNFSPAERIAPVRKPSWKYVSGNFKQVQLYTGITFPVSKNIQDFYSFLVFSTAFGESMSSRLFQNIREKKGLCYSIYSLRSYFTHVAEWLIYANTSEDLFTRLIESLNEEFHRLLDTFFTDMEIKNAVSHLAGGVILSKEDMENRMKRMVRQYLMIGEILDISQSIEILHQIEVHHIQSIKEQYIRSELFNLLAYGSRNLKKYRLVRFDF